MINYTNFKYCPSCGQATLEIISENGIKCNVCNFVYFHNTASAAAAILVTPQGILLTKRAHEPKAGMLDVPGGFVNYNESIETALARELHEELSIKVTNYQYIGSFPNIYLYKDITYFTTDAFFICIYDNRIQPVPNEEIEEIVYVDPGSIPFDLLAFDSAKAAFKLNISQLLKELI